MRWRIAYRAVFCALGVWLAATACLQAAGFPRTVVDVTGRALRLEAPPRRIVSTFLGADEIVLSLVDRSRVAMVTTFAQDPASSFVVAAAQGIRAVQNINAETIVALKPDLILVNRFSNPEVVEQLIALGQPV
ncbi:MAG TPA: ABC transporter substrate-binding protein, partial [Limnochordia bacterium]